MHMSYHYHFISGDSANLASQFEDKSTATVSFAETEWRRELHYSNALAFVAHEKAHFAC